MTITGGSSLPKDDIDRMVREAEEHAAEDKARREAAEVRNNAEQLVYSLEKLISENEDKIADPVKDEVRGDIESLKTALQGEDEAAIKSAFDKLNESQTKLGEAIYQASTEAAEGPSPTSGTADGSEEDVVDAEIVDDEDENPSTGSGRRK